MHKHRRIALIRKLLATAWLVAVTPTWASGIPTFDGASFSQHLLSVMNQTEQLAQQVLLVKQNMTNLQTLPGSVLDVADRLYGSQGAAFRELGSTVSELAQAGSSLKQMYDRAGSEMKSLNMTPERWSAAFLHLARERGGIYRRQLDHDLSAMNAFAVRSQNLRRLSSQIPGIEGNVQGLQLLNQQSSVLASELLEMRGLMQRQVVLDLQDRTTKEDLNKVSIEAAQARYNSISKDAEDKRSAISKFTDLQFGVER